MGIKLGICNFITPGTGVFAAKLVKEAGLDGMSLDYGRRKYGYPLSQPKVLEGYKEARDYYGIEYANIGFSAGDWDPIWVDKGHPYFDEIEEKSLDAVDVAEYFGLPLVYFATFHESLPDTYEKRKSLAKRFQRICDKAASKGIEIAWENPLEVEEQMEVLHLVDRDNFKFFYDGNNFVYFKGYNQVEILDKLYPYMTNQLHVKDGTEGKSSNAILGTGVSDFFGIAKYLKEHNYNGWIILENMYEYEDMRHLNPDYFELMKQDVKVLKDTFF